MDKGIPDTRKLIGCQEEATPASRSLAAFWLIDERWSGTLTRTSDEVLPQEALDFIIRSEVRDLNGVLSIIESNDVVGKVTP